MGGFLAFGPYAGYLLIAYGVTALVVIGNMVAARSQFRRTQLRLREQLARRAGGRRGGAAPRADKGRNEDTVGRDA